MLTLQLRLNESTFFISCVYRPPSASISEFNDSFSNEILVKLQISNSIICGDFNVNLFNPYNSIQVDNFVSAMHGYNFYPIIDKATRLSPDNQITKYSLIDHIWFNFCPTDPG